MRCEVGFESSVVLRAAALVTKINTRSSSMPLHYVSQRKRDLEEMCFIYLYIHLTV